jgi:VanZ family protein
MKMRKSSFQADGAGEMSISIRSGLIAWSPPLLWSIGIFYFSSLPSSVFHLPSIRLLDKLIHVIVFGILNLLVLRGCRKIGTRKKGFFFGIFYSLLFGLSDEVHQYFVPGRFADPLDFLANAIGILISSWIFIKFYAITDTEIENDKVQVT